MADVAFRLGRYLRFSLWPLPLLCVAAGVGLSFGTLAIDRAAGYDLIPRGLTGSPAGAQYILSTVAASTVTLASLVLTLTLVAVQLAMGQFSPRIVGSLLNDRRSQLAIGLFGATFAYSILVLRVVDDERGRVPGLSMVVAYVLVLASIATLILYVHHAGQSLRATALIDIAGEDLDEQLQRVYAYAPSPEEVDPALITASQSGAVIKIRSALLVAAAQAASCRLEMLPAMGDFVPAGAALLRIHGDAGRLDGDRVADYVVLSDERTHEDDPAYGFRALVDIAERSIAQPFTDPTTAKQAIDRLHDALRQLAPRTIPTGRHYDEAGQLRLTVPTLGWHGFVRLAFDELRLAGSGSPQVTRRLQAALQDLKVAAPPERHPPLDEQLALLQAAVKRRVEGDEVAGALIADPQGIGSGTDLLVGAMPQKPTPRQEEN